MDVALEQLPDDINALKRMVGEQQAVIERKQKALEHQQRKITDQLETISAKQSVIERLEEQLRLLQQRQFGKRSEKSPGQAELQFFNEAELLELEARLAESEAERVQVPVHSRRRATPRALPKDLPRIEVIHDLPEADKRCACGRTLEHIGDETLEQLAIIPLQYYVIRHLKRKYACACQGCIRTASMPRQPLPATQASPQLLAQVMVSKYHDGLPLYRQEKMAAREGLELPRAKLARWMIDGSAVFQPVWNLLEETFFDYDIALADETGIQVLKEEGRTPQTKSYLWIRRGGPPHQPVVLVDYSPSRSGAIASGLLAHFRGYLVCDAYGGYNASITDNGLVPVFCNDHARRKFVEVLKALDPKAKEKAKGWVASKAIAFYKRLYRLEKGIKHLPPPQRHAARQERAVPLWDEFLGWAREVQALGVAHAGTREALAYLINHGAGLRRYCDDGRLPISNIQAEHVAKAIAVPRKNFLFADTPAGATASARIYSLLETAKANKHHPQRYLSVLLTELPNITCVEDVEALLPWQLTPEEVNRKYAGYPTV